MKKKILLVEDEDILRENLQEILELNDYNVFSCSNAEEAIVFLKTQEVALVISDLMMPLMNGFEFLEYLKSNQDYKVIPFILLSAKIETKDRSYGLALGADFYLTKPIKTIDLIKSIRSLIG